VSPRCAWPLVTWARCADSATPGALRTSSYTEARVIEPVEAQVFSLRNVEVPHQTASANSSNAQTVPQSRPDEA
jgi:hypothetical protein